ncbi:uncharacterized protein LOC143431769 [Xylocopa sonorina]|uniref:uncharacterized protein LOC143431769 n=1 Tax=Xylocopa sonorina TaxID=1818115 RepID=UPI00403ABB03
MQSLHNNNRLIKTLRHSQSMNREHIPIPANIKLADPTLAFGAGPTLSFLSTQLGWRIGGSILGHDNKAKPASQTYCSAKMQFDLERFWKIEENATQTHLSLDEAFQTAHTTAGKGQTHKGRTDDQPGYYLPHHAVIKESSQTTKKYVLTGDIEKMYRQFLVREEDRRFQKILWRNSSGNIQPYHLDTVTFGLSAAPYLATRCIHQLANGEAEQYPLAANTLKQDLYVDGGEQEATIKTLGIYWNSQTDTINYSVSPVSIGNQVSKRSILSDIAKIFDPLGLLGPVVVKAKILLQQLWLLKLHWDETSSTYNSHGLDNKTTLDEADDIQLHCFCDASEKAFGACIYLRTFKRGQVQCTLLCSRIRVAPLKQGYITLSNKQPTSNRGEQFFGPIESQRYRTKQTPQSGDISHQSTTQRIYYPEECPLRTLPLSEPETLPEVKRQVCLGKTAHNRILYLVQAECFPSEMQDLKEGRVRPESKLNALSPFLDPDGLIRVGGRLQNSNLTYDRKHPIILPQSHHITSLIIEQAHIRNLHSGILSTLRNIRQRYWPSIENTKQIYFQE